METILTAVLPAAITGGLALVGVILSNRSSERRMQSELKISQAVTEPKLDELTREVREHNNYAKRMPVLEEQLKVVSVRPSVAAAVLIRGSIEKLSPGMEAAAGEERAVEESGR